MYIWFQKIKKCITHLNACIHPKPKIYGYGRNVLLCHFLWPKCPWPKYPGRNVHGENVRGQNVLGRNVRAPHIHGRTSFVILCNASIKRNGQSATTYTFLLHLYRYFQVGKQRITNIWYLTLNAQIATKVVCFSRLLKCLRRLYCKECGPTSDCSYRSSLFWVHAIFFYT